MPKSRDAGCVCYGNSMYNEGCGQKNDDIRVDVGKWMVFYMEETSIYRHNHTSEGRQDEM